ncbi:peptidase S49 family protein [Burkholderia sp. MSHR3999]|uniref:S49 family peptidase n=1 Tax=Burkholderia sp. MSHR3999 TaxID=1542965 RepID=UPI0005ACFC5A|nr:S49 family peptidase [Burkholderia sp. MSHR3999]KIP13330.1 peptidase S49 family protein [Burkholderia sp. MSHR3999]
MKSYPHIAARALNRPLLLEPGYARLFFAALSPRLNISELVLASGESLEGQAIAGALNAYDPARGYRAYDVQNGVAVIPVDGTLVHKNAALNPVSGMQGYDGIEAKLAGALADPEVRGIMLDMNSPGGEVSGVKDLAAKIAASSKPVWAHANELAASACYWLGSAADRLIVTETAEVGSVGVLVAHGDYSKQLEDDGIKVTLIHSGASKVDGNPYEPLPEGVRDRWQGELDDLRMLFASSVAVGRKMDVQAVLDTEARLYRGRAAVDAGLADAVMPFSDALNEFSTTLSGQGGTSKGSVLMSTQGARADAPGQDVMSAAEAVRLAEEARAEGVKAGVDAERARIGAILQHAEAVDRGESAVTLALTPGMTPETAGALLATFPKAATGGRTVAELADAANVKADLAGQTVDKKQAFAEKSAALWKKHG